MSLQVSQEGPPASVGESFGSHHHHHGSVGPVVAVLVVIVILGAMAVAVGRLCSGKSIMGYGQYDLETWAHSKCSSCIDGNVAAEPRLNASTATNTVSMPPPPV